MDLSKKTVKDLQECLKEHGVNYSGLKKQKLIEYCENATLNQEADPGGLRDDRETVLMKKKLTVHTGQALSDPNFLQKTQELSFLPKITIFDIYIYLLRSNDIDHKVLQDFDKLEGQVMFKDGYVQHMGCFTNRVHKFVSQAPKIQLPNFSKFLVLS